MACAAHRRRSFRSRGNEPHEPQALKGQIRGVALSDREGLDGVSRRVRTPNCQDHCNFGCGGQPVNGLLARYVCSHIQSGPGHNAVVAREARLRCSAKDVYDPPSEDDAPYSMQSSRP